MRCIKGVKPSQVNVLTRMPFVEDTSVQCIEVDVTTKFFYFYNEDILKE